MAQKDFKNSSAVRVGIPRNGWSGWRCFLSPVMMHEAWEAMASSKTMFSSGSLQSLIFSLHLNFNAFVSENLIGSSLSSSEIKYGSFQNFFAYPHSNFVRNLYFSLGSEPAPGKSHFGFDFNYNPFHNQLYFFSKLS